MNGCFHHCSVIIKQQAVILFAIIISGKEMEMFLMKFGAKDSKVKKALKTKHASNAI